jgi:hypothetical protein
MLHPEPLCLDHVISDKEVAYLDMLGFKMVLCACRYNTLKDDSNRCLRNWYSWPRRMYLPLPLRWNWSGTVKAAVSGRRNSGKWCRRLIGTRRWCQCQIVARAIKTFRSATMLAGSSTHRVAGWCRRATVHHRAYTGSIYISIVIPTGKKQVLWCSIQKAKPIRHAS